MVPQLLSNLCNNALAQLSETFLSSWTRFNLIVVSSVSSPDPSELSPSQQEEEEKQNSYSKGTGEEVSLYVFEK